MNPDSIDLEKVLDSQVTISAVAHNAKAGAVVMTDQNEVIYLRDLREWQDALLGRRVLIEGVLRRQHVYPEVRTEDGAISQGISGKQWIIDVKHYRLID